MVNENHYVDKAEEEDEMSDQEEQQDDKSSSDDESHDSYVSDEGNGEYGE